MFFVYILASQTNGTLYIGVTNNLVRRVYEHKNKIIKGFTEKYKVDKLVYFEQFEDIETAINREKQLKTFKREWKMELIEKNNKSWKDLYKEVSQL